MTSEITPARQWLEDHSCCKWSGYLYSPEVQRCWKHATPEQRELVDGLDRRARGQGILEMHGGKPLWPYGPNINVEARSRMLEWTEFYDLRRAGRRVHGCLHWLRTGRCGRLGCLAEFTQRYGWADHVTAWNRGRTPKVLVAQPYGLSDKGRRELQELDKEPDLRVEIREDSWYGCGTTFIGIWRKRG